MQPTYKSVNILCEKLIMSENKSEKKIKFITPFETRTNSFIKYDKYSSKILSNQS